ncbi:MAG: sigma 54-interacting transcriptional regulator [bacterium]|nr:MAG: sigma 54-interacting transcriptional regulator [bacterium]
MSFKKFISSEKIVLGAIALFFCLISSINLSFNQRLDDFSCDILFHLRGPRTVSDDIIFVYISQEDIQNLGGWPLSRDYYAYLIHHLRKNSVKAVGIDILFEQPAVRYQEFDDMLATFIQESENLILPFTFAELRIAEGSPEPGDQWIGINPTFPLEKFTAAAAGIGFSNLGKPALIREVPLVATFGDQYFLSFGAELARLFSGWTPRVFLPVHRDSSNLEQPQILSKDELRSFKLNHFGSPAEITSFGFLDFMSTLENETADLNLKDKMVIVGVSAPGKSTTSSSPLSEALPATLIHVTVAENLINNNFLRDIPAMVNWILIAVLIFLVWATSRQKNQNLVWGYRAATILVFGFFASFLFTYFFFIISLIYPIVALVASIIYLEAFQKQRRSIQDHELRRMLEEQISKKEHEIHETQQKLKEYRLQLADREKYSEELLELAEERKKSLLQLETEVRDLHAYMKTPRQTVVGEEFVDIIHAPQSKLKEILELVQRIRSDNIPVLIIGETGSGKEIIARAIHNTSPRKGKAFLAVNCGALTETLLESELFGHEKGSFTGASSRRRGRFELANGGTIFLDEVTETSPSFQAKLLRVLQEGSFERVGGEENIKVDIRIIAASNKEIQELVDQNQFRSDLFYRLNGFLIRIPSLAERTEDIPLLAEHFLKKYDYQPVDKFSNQVMEILSRYKWPGNVRELENVVRRAAIMAKSDNRQIIRFSDLPEDIQQRTEIDSADDLYLALEDQILKALRSFEFSHASISQTAKVLGNKDRGTITEYFRGIIFETLVKENFDIDACSQSLSASTKPEVLERVQKKINHYLNNLLPLPELPDSVDADFQQISQFKGLPKKYHPYLKQVIQHLQKKM